MSTLIVRAELAGPPSVAQSFRDLTLYSKIRYHPDILIEIEKDARDFYYNWMKSRGLLDFVEQFITPFEESGVVIDNVLPTRPRSIYVQRIVPANLRSLLGEISTLL